MSKFISLIKNTGILFIAKVSSQLVSFLLLPFYTSLLSTAEYGRIDIYTTLQMIVVPLLTLQIEMGLFRYLIITEDEKEKKTIISSGISVFILISVVVGLLFVCISQIVHIEYWQFLFFYYISISCSAILLQISRAFGDNKGYGLGSFIITSLSMILNVIFIGVFHYKIEGFLLASIIAQVVCCVFLSVRLKIFGYLDLSAVTKKDRIRLIKYSYPLIFNQVASWMINYSNRIIIVLFWGESYNGIFSAASKFSNITNTFFSVINLAWTENVVRYIGDKNDSYISNVFEIIFSFYLFIVTAIVNLVPLVFSLLIKKDFVSAYPQVPVLLVSMLFSGMAATVGSIYIASDKTKNVSITTIASGIVNVLVHFALIKNFHLFAASISTLVAFVFLFLYRLYKLKDFYSLRFSKNYIIIQFFILVLSCVLFYFKNKYMCLVGFTINVAFVCIYFYKKIINIRTILDGT